jgi:hypothetical protein
LIQPYLPAVAEEGEYSFLFFGGEFSHCAQKVPARGDYRVQSRFGAKEHVYAPSSDELALARRVLAAANTELLYARVDMVRGLDGALAVMELELIEPYLYPEQGPRMGELFADALVRPEVFCYGTVFSATAAWLAPYPSRARHPRFHSMNQKMR